MTGGGPMTAGTADTPASVLQTEALAKTYVVGFFRQKIRAITDVSLRVERGEIFGLLGPNGAGKTTTLKVVLGLVRPTGGKATLLGEPVGGLAAKRRVGYLPESPYFYDYLTGRELLHFFAQLFGFSRAEGKRRAGELLERVGLDHAADLALRRYSKGMLQRVGVAQALINDPELVILDEPLTGLDPLGRKQLRELIVALREEGKTVVLSSHILSDVELLADGAAILVKGRTVATGPLHELINAQVLSTEVLFSGRTEALDRALADAGQRVEQQGEVARVVLEGDQAPDAVIDLIRQHQGRLVALTPRKESLEDVVVSRIEQDQRQEHPPGRHEAQR